MISNKLCLCLPIACLLATSLHAQSIINEVRLSYSKTLAFAGDLNGDGISELLVGHGTGDFKVRVIDGHSGNLLYGVGNGNRGPLGRSMAGIGDTDGDGVPDFVLGRPGYVRLVSGIDGSTLMEKRSSGKGFGRSLCPVGDLDGDGAMDWAAGFAKFVRIYSGANGSLIRVLGAPPGTNSKHSLLQGAGDLDGDGLDEILVAWIHNGARDVVTLVSGGTGATLHTWQAELSGNQPLGLAGDVDADGILDIAILHQETGSVNFYSTQSGALIGSLSLTGWPWAQSRIASAGDMDGDGRDDLWVGFSDAKGPFGACSGIAAVFSSATGQTLMQHSGNGGLRRLGTALISGDDMDGDGLSDCVILGRGFTTDDSLVRLVSGTCNPPSGGSFCPTSPNSAGPGARLGLSSPASASAQTLDVNLNGGVPSSFGVLMITRSGIPPTPFGDGIACVLPFLLWQGGIQMTDAAGNALIHVPLSQLSFSPFPGDTVYIQYRYRDPAGPLGTGFNYSDGYRVTLCQ